MLARFEALELDLVLLQDSRRYVTRLCQTLDYGLRFGVELGRAGTNSFHRLEADGHRAFREHAVALRLAIPL